MWEKPVNSLLQRLNPSFKITCSPVYTQKIYFLEILKIMGLTPLWCIFTNYWEVKSRKDSVWHWLEFWNLKARKKDGRGKFYSVFYPKIYRICWDWKDLSIGPHIVISFLFQKRKQQFLSQFSFGPSFLCKQNYLNSGWVLVYFKSCMWCSNNC